MVARHFMPGIGTLLQVVPCAIHDKLGFCSLLAQLYCADPRFERRCETLFASAVRRHVCPDLLRPGARHHCFVYQLQGGRVDMQNVWATIFAPLFNWNQTTLPIQVLVSVLVASTHSVLLALDRSPLEFCRRLRCVTLTIGRPRARASSP
jgi:hypothetical protein